MLLSVVDIDSKKMSLDIQMKYTNEVPVLVLDSTRLLKKIELQLTHINLLDLLRQSEKNHHS